MGDGCVVRAMDGGRYSRGRAGRSLGWSDCLGSEDLLGVFLVIIRWLGRFGLMGDWPVAGAGCVATGERR